MKSRCGAGTVRGSQALALRLLDWHGGQGDPIYAVGSSWNAGRCVETSLVEEALSNLRSTRESVKRNPNYKSSARRHLDSVIERLEKIVG